jgi:two-component system response regulator BaeR
MTNTILIVEDEPALAQLLADYFQAADYQTHIIARGDQVDTWLQQHSAAAVILDLMLPGKEGLEVCKDIRAYSNVPILMTTARVEEIDRLLGLELGADDYICKPYSPREVVARVKTVLRRTQAAATAPASAHFELQPERCQVLVNNHSIELTSTENELLRLLTSEPGRIYSRNHIMDNIYSDYRIVSERTIDSHVKKLRKKIAQAEPEHDFVQSVYGVGYKFEPKL